MREFGSPLPPSPFFPFTPATQVKFVALLALPLLSPLIHFSLLCPFFNSPNPRRNNQRLLVKYACAAGYSIFLNECGSPSFSSHIGWGKTLSNSTFSDVLQEAKMPVVDYDTCAAGNINLAAEVDDDTMVCAGYGGNSVVSGCHGDSGGPFVCKESGRWVLRGAVSWGDHWCRGGSTYSVFARISRFVDWIHTNKMKPQCVPGKIKKESLFKNILRHRNLSGLAIGCHGGLRGRTVRVQALTGSVCCVLG